MPQVEGNDWSDIAEQIRESSLELSEQQRITMCMSLANSVKQLEEKGISHRDLSGGNIFIELSSSTVSLIDFDSLFHQSLRIPVATTIGSEGYIAPFVDPDDSVTSYCRFADRFALSILCVEFLLTNSNSKVYHDDAMFNQEHLYQRSGDSVRYAKTHLHQNFPDALRLFEAAINSSSFKNCPSPDSWLEFCQGSDSCIMIDSLPDVNLRLPQAKSVFKVKLPDNPWNLIEGDNKNGNTTKFTFKPSTPVASLPRPIDFSDINHTRKYLLENGFQPASNKNSQPFDNYYEQLVAEIHGQVHTSDIFKVGIPESALIESMDIKNFNR
jgi:serine/threonine protein kinase